jgi:putative colanic acid biosynthesis UDP-glucose lipid carrier transferase
VAIVEQLAGERANAVIGIDAFAPPRHVTASPTLKRTLDLMIALPLLIVLLPILLLLALWVKLDSRGPIFFHQTRHGVNGCAFDILKFRSMHVMENGEEVAQAMRNDPRVTRAGRLMRETSLDELPQLLNVIKGEMSLVGPRPHAVAHDKFYGDAIPGYLIRQRVKPGITGWAQVHGLRGATPTVESMRERVELDIWYARNRRLLLDIEILFRTFGEVLRRRNAH